MDSGYLLRLEHEEFAKRMQDEHKRQDQRIEELEETLKQNNKLLVSVERLAVSMENMQKEVRDQGDRLETLESRDGEMWRKIVGYVATAIAGGMVTFIFTQIGL